MRKPASPARWDLRKPKMEEVRGCGLGNIEQETRITFFFGKRNGRSRFSRPLTGITTDFASHARAHGAQGFLFQPVTYAVRFPTALQLDRFFIA